MSGTTFAAYGINAEGKRESLATVDYHSDAAKIARRYLSDYAHTLVSQDDYDDDANFTSAETHYYRAGGYTLQVDPPSYRSWEGARDECHCDLTYADPPRVDTRDCWSSYEYADDMQPEPDDPLWPMRRALTEMASPSMNGYPGMFVGDGYILCTACGIAELCNPDNDADDMRDLAYAVDWSSPDITTGQYCEHCNATIQEPQCPDCGREEPDLGNARNPKNALVSNLSGDRNVCRDCIASALMRQREIDRADALDYWINHQRNEHRTRATLIGPHAYRLSNAWFAGDYGEGAYAAHEEELDRRGVCRTCHRAGVCEKTNRTCDECHDHRTNPPKQPSAR